MKYLLIALAFTACTNFSKRRDAGVKVSTEVLDTIKTAPVKITASPVIFESAFIKGTTQKVKDSDFHLYGITIGKLKIISGRIVACDPLHVEEYGKPYTQAFPTGEFPVQLSIAKYGEEELTAFARISFSEEPVERWELALLKGQQSFPVGGEEVQDFGVDAGVGIYIDEAAIKSFDQSKLYGNKSELFRELNKHYHNYWRYCMYNSGQDNLAAFSTGMGDGRYATYIGFDAQGQPCRLVSDFKLFNWRRE